MRCSLLALVLAATACSSHAQPQTPHTSSAADLESKTVALVEARGSEVRAYCSGVWVKPDAFLTAAHCVADSLPGESVSYVTREDLRADHADDLATLRVGELESLDEGHDLALIRVRLAPEHPIAKVSNDVRVGQPAQTMGHPLGLWWSYSSGNVSALRLMALDGPEIWWVQTSAPISPGNSGGGLFDEDGDLLGLCHATFLRGQNLNVYVHAQYLSAFIEASR